MQSKKFKDIIEMRSLLSTEWLNAVGEEFSKPYWDNIIDTLNKDKDYLPSKRFIFNALNKCPPEKVKVVIIGQDPYIQSNQPHGFSFSVRRGVRMPPSLRNVLEELSTEYNIDSLPKDGCLEAWASEGVLLLNSVLTVSAGKSNSHKDIGWENFTSAVIRYLDNHNIVVFMAWGRSAQTVCSNNVRNNRILTAGHPSPLNTSHTFKGCGCFREANEILKKNKILPVRWIKIWS